MPSKHRKTLYPSQGKGTQNQCKIVYNYLKRHTATASMVEAATGVKQKNICRYKKTMENQGVLWQVKKGRCVITGHIAWYLTTDPNKKPSHLPNQLKLF